MKARRGVLAWLNRRHSRGLDTQCWQRIPSLVVTMDTTSTPISIALHMARRVKAKLPRQSVEKWKLWLFHAWRRSRDGGHDLKHEAHASVWRRLCGETGGKTGLWGTWVWQFQLHALLQTSAYILNHEHTHLKLNAMHTEPPNASIIQTQSYSACFSCFFFITYSFCLVALLGATAPG